MTELTKEQLIEEAKLKIAIAKCHPNSGMAQVEGELFKIALASLEAEPDYIRYECCCCGWETIEDWRENDVCPKCNHKPMGTTALYTAPPAPVVPEGLVKAVRFYEQVKCENPPAETGAWKDAVDWVLKEACCAVILGKADNPLASSNQVGELTMWLKRLVSQLKKANPDCKLPEKAMEYLKQNGLVGVKDVLR
ncbi:hypothetical protein E5S53_20515 [Escherichia coli]|uniref:hypothetical protein n=1 Tax=Escherichia coli TaxID=562 RepID=UPI00107FC13D|nr:hypothetical protein [Escherichia coli]TGH07642.1 hypothetical protein E5S55_20660 [Escherichia coli]TGH50032.1 hypothetical protein E5S53_20515 [Escherichia coli]